MGSRRRISVPTLVVGWVLLGCAGPAATTVPETTTDPVRALDGVTGELIVTRQRDLLDRGLINVLTRNGSGTDLLLSNRRLIADHFSPDPDVAAPAATRTISVRSGFQVAIQVPYGVASDCATVTPVTASLGVTYTQGDDAEPREATIGLAGTEILDEIRAEQCTARSFAEQTSTSIVDAVVGDGTVTAAIRIEPTGDATGDAPVVITVHGVSGTILVAVDAVGGPAPTIIGGSPIVVPIRFTVNRCDPHALAEVTKRYGVQLSVSIDGATPRPVPLDIGPITPALDAIVQQCVEQPD